MSIMPLFGKSHKNPADIVRTLKENLAILVKQDKKTDKVEEDSVFCVPVFVHACMRVCACVHERKCLGVQGPKGDRPL